MNNCKKIQHLFEKSLYGELTTGEEKILDEHLSSCEACSKEYAELKSTLELVQTNRVRETDEQFMEDFWDNLEPKLQKQKSFITILHENLKDIIRFRTGWKYQLAAGLTVLFIGIFIGKYITNGNIDYSQKTSGPTQIAQVNLKAETNDYIQRAKVLLLGLMNFDPATEDVETISFQKQQNISKDLIKQATFLKSNLNDPDQMQMKRLVSDIEIVLLQIANMETKFDLDGIELVKDGVDSKGLIMKINLEEIRENAAKSFKQQKVSTKKENKKI